MSGMLFRGHPTMSCSQCYSGHVCGVPMWHFIFHHSTQSPSQRGSDLASAEWEVASLLSSERKNVLTAVVTDTLRLWLLVSLCQIPIRQPCVLHWNNTTVGGYSNSQALPCSVNTQLKSTSWSPIVYLMFSFQETWKHVIQAAAFWLGSLEFRCQKPHFPARTHLCSYSRNCAARDTHWDNVKGLPCGMCTPVLPAPFHQVLCKTQLCWVGNLGLRGRFVPQDVRPSTTETSVMTSHSVAGTIHGTARGSVLRLRYSTLLSGNQGFVESVEVSGRSGVVLRWLDKKNLLKELKLVRPHI